MNELRLLFDRAADGDYTVRLDNNWGGNASRPRTFTPLLDEDDFENLRWYLEEFMDLPDGGSVTRANVTSLSRSCLLGSIKRCYRIIAIRHTGWLF